MITHSKIVSSQDKTLILPTKICRETDHVGLLHTLQTALMSHVNIPCCYIKLNFTMLTLTSPVLSSSHMREYRPGRARHLTQSPRLAIRLRLKSFRFFISSFSTCQSGECNATNLVTDACNYLTGYIPNVVIVLSSVIDCRCLCCGQPFCVKFYL